MLTSALLIDDDQTTNFVNKKLLRDTGCLEEVLVALNGHEGINLLQEQYHAGRCPNLILLDVNMPVMSGFDFLEAFNELDIEKNSIKIIMLTTSMHPRDINRLGDLPTHGFLNKPLTREKLKGLLKEHFDID
ncbi:response regulator [Pontibacter sp. JH31]|uniref:Response regulator n=1 Tax=Pontibacter aquaedesilientis TaxID=2766980 RepID=A0ABR7XEL1_9BACT|nr:response regulator [Pontibacter aquaedesilientis]